MIRVGTSGFKFDDWKGSFYPDSIKQKDWLSYYGRRFDCLEVNASYYRLFHPATFVHMANKVPENFAFTVKAYRTLTHEPGSENEEDFDTFLTSLAPLVEAEKFGCVLAQFPTSFHNTPGNRGYLADFCGRFQEHPLVVEFRNREWVKDEVFEFLRDRGVGWCAVDEPQFRSLMPPIVRATSPVGYVRFHGRNYKTWWKGDKKTRYDYLYSEDELREWVPKIQQLDGETDVVYVFMNNCFGGQAAKNAVDMQHLLGLEPQLAATDVAGEPVLFPDPLDRARED